MIKMTKTGLVLVFILIIGLVSQVLAVPEMPTKDSKLSAAKQIKQIHNLAKNKYLIAKNAYISSKSEFLTARSKWQLAKNIDNEDQVVDKGKKFLAKSVNKIINQLEQIKTRVETSEFIVEQEELITELNIHINILENLQDIIVDIESQEDLIAVSKIIKKEWVKTKLIVKKHAGFVLVSKAKAGIAKARKISGKIDIKIQNLEEQGFDVSEFNERLSLVKQNIIHAENSLKEAQTIYSEISNVETANSLFIEASSNIKQAKNILKKTYVEIKDIVIKLRTIEV
jgi:hypothetical protein